MQEKTKQEVKEILKNKFEFLIERYIKEIDKRISQLNNIWFSKTMPSIDLFDSLCHSIKISFGNVYEDVITAIAKENFQILPKELTGKITSKTLEEIRTIVDDNRYNKKLNVKEELERIKKSQEKAEKEGREKTTKVDLILTKDNTLFLLEIKSGGKHDIGKSQKMKDETLTNFALGLTKNPNLKSYVALTYNPQGDKDDFNWGCMTHFKNPERLII